MGDDDAVIYSTGSIKDLHNGYVERGIHQSLLGYSKKGASNVEKLPVDSPYKDQ